MNGSYVLTCNVHLGPLLITDGECYTNDVLYVKIETP